MQWKDLWVLFLILALIFAPLEAAAPASGEAAIPREPEKYVALTFDDGPRASTTGRLLDGLKERGASATFFLIGRQIEGNEDLVRRMREEGHQVGNHTWDHMKLQGLPAAKMEEQVGRTDAALRELLGEDDYWLRPPYGLLSEDQRGRIGVPMVHWSVDPEDWKLLNTDAVVRAVLAKVKPGDIILLHDFYPTSVDAALRIVDALSREGYWFVTVEELLTLNQTEAEPGKMYRSATQEAY